MKVGVLGATGLVGERLLRLLSQSGCRVEAYSRQTLSRVDEYIEWRHLPLTTSPSPKPYPQSGKGTLPFWICTMPIWALPDYFDLLEASGAKRVVALSSTSRFTKEDSSDPAEQIIANQLVHGEACLQAWAEARDIEWVILRPTLIYGFGKDKNVVEIARLICRWGLFPLLGEGRGLRQPIHAEDVTLACQAAISSPAAKNQSFNLSGGEVLPYKKMVERIFSALNRKPCFISLPRWGFQCVVWGLRRLPRFHHWSVAMVDRMNRDMVFDHSEAREILGFAPRPFNLGLKDLPESCR